MQKISLSIDCEAVNIRTAGYNGNQKVALEITNADAYDFNNEEVAKLISISTLIKAHGGLNSLLEEIMEDFDGVPEIIVELLNKREAA